MKVLGSILDISRTESVMANGSEVTVMDNGSENPVTIGIMTFATTG